MPVRKPEIEKKTWAASMIRKRLTMIEIWEGEKPGAIRRDNGFAAAKMTMERARKTRMIKFMVADVMRQAAASSLAKYRVKVGIKAAEREPMTRS